NDVSGPFPILRPERGACPPLARWIVQVARQNQIEVFEGRGIAVPGQSERKGQRVGAGGLRGQPPSGYEFRVTLLRGVDIRSREALPARKEGCRLNGRLRRCDQGVDRPERALQQRRPLK